MKDSHFRGATALFAFLLCIGTVSGYKPYKSRELGSSRILGNFCGLYIKLAYDFVCIRGKRGHRSTTLKGKETLNFLRNSRTPRTTAYTDIVEDCCKEGCAVEEIHEYCW